MDGCFLTAQVYKLRQSEELDHIAERAKENNLNLNSSKSKEMIIRRPKTRPFDDLPGKLQELKGSNPWIFWGWLFDMICQSKNMLTDWYVWVGTNYVCSEITQITWLEWPEFMGGGQSYYIQWLFLHIVFPDDTSWENPLPPFPSPSNVQSLLISASKQTDVWATLCSNCPRESRCMAGNHCPYYYVPMQSLRSFSMPLLFQNGKPQ